MNEILQRLYYSSKPYMPWALRMALRRRRAQNRRVNYKEVWPINPRAAVVPPGWTGWPGGKRFAIVLTHDVEANQGFARVDSLMRLEQQFDFRSSFNFVPQGDYQVTSDVCGRLEHAGFEVGIHGLRHDGKFYFSKRSFAADAVEIRKYARDWNAVGFRSPLMQHKLAWLHQLQLEYDSSTFDTDPFEPQSDAVETIFPFWVPGFPGHGYVELPYTLPQDFSLFVVLQERNTDIWKQKLDWIAERGGMALLITHPDYMCFEGELKRDEYPVGYYEELLKYARDKYSDSFWAALPREVTQYYCEALPPILRNTRKKICMLAYTHYERDNRVRRYSEALTARGDLVDVIALAANGANQSQAQVSGVTVHGIQGREKNEKSKLTYAFRLLRFLAKSAVFLTRQHALHRYDVIHVHNVPDFLVFAAWYPKWSGAKVILDIHDIVPELYANKFKAGSESLYVSQLKRVERMAARFADHVIVSNHLWHKKLVARSVEEEKCSTFINHVDTSIFYRHPRTRNDDKVVVVFPGSFQWHQGLDLAIEAVGLLKGRVPNIDFQIYGDGPEAQNLAELTRRLGLSDSVRFCGTVRLDQVPAVIANADLGVVPKRADGFGDEAFSTKIMEFMSQGVPVIASRTKIDTFYYTEKIVRFFDSGVSQSLADAMLDVIENPGLRESLVTAGYEYIDANNWGRNKKDYFALLDSLTVEPFREDQVRTHVPVISR